MSNVKVSLFIQEVKHELSVEEAEQLYKDLGLLFKRESIQFENSDDQFTYPSFLGDRLKTGVEL